MNYLQLVQRTKREAGVSGGGPSSTVGLTGEAQRLADWVRDAYTDIQNAQTFWNWLHKTATVPVIAGQQTFNPVTDWEINPLRYMTDSFWVYAASDGPSFGNNLNRDDYSRIRNYTPAGVARPTAFIVMPNRDVRLNAIPDQDYSLTLDYYAAAETLGQDDDVPSIPEQYHLAIVWKALQFYADYEEVPYLRQTATAKYMQIHDQMLRTEAPVPHLGGPLA